MTKNMALRYPPSAFLLLVYSDAALELVPGEEFSGAFGRSARDIAMPHDILVRDTVEIFERRYKKDERIKHLVGKPGFTIVTHYTYPDRFLVPITLLGMRSVHLFEPAGPHFDLSHSFSARPIIDQKMIPHPIIPAPVEMQFVDIESIPLIRRGMMDHDIRPTRGDVKGDVRPRTARVRDQKFLPLFNLARVLDMVNSHDRRHIDAVDT